MVCSQLYFLKRLCICASKFTIIEVFIVVCHTPKAPKTSHVKWIAQTYNESSVTQLDSQYGLLVYPLVHVLSNIVLTLFRCCCPTHRYVQLFQYNVDCCNVCCANCTFKRMD